MRKQKEIRKSKKKMKKQCDHHFLIEDKSVCSKCGRTLSAYVEHEQPRILYDHYKSGGGRVSFQEFHRRLKLRRKLDRKKLRGWREIYAGGGMHV